jgi:2'-5' RNA ligase
MPDPRLSRPPLPPGVTWRPGLPPGVKPVDQRFPAVRAPRMPRKGQRNLLTTLESLPPGTRVRVTNILRRGGQRGGPGAKAAFNFIIGARPTWTNKTGRSGWAKPGQVERYGLKLIRDEDRGGAPRLLNTQSMVRVDVLGDDGESSQTYRRKRGSHNAVPVSERRYARDAARRTQGANQSLFYPRGQGPQDTGDEAVQPIKHWRGNRGAENFRRWLNVRASRPWSPVRPKDVEAPPGEAYNEDARTAVHFADDDGMRGLYICIDLDEWNAKRYREKKPEDDSPPHITVLYMGKQSSATADAVAEKVSAALNEVAQFGVEGIGRDVFEKCEDGKDAVYTPVHGEELHALRRTIQSAARSAGAVWSDTHPIYKPHVTIKYVEHGTGMDVEPVDNWYQTVDKVAIRHGDRLVSTAPLGKPRAKFSESVHFSNPVGAESAGANTVSQFRRDIHGKRRRGVSGPSVAQRFAAMFSAAPRSRMLPGTSGAGQFVRERVPGQYRANVLRSMRVASTTAPEQAFSILRPDELATPYDSDNSGQNRVIDSRSRLTHAVPTGGRNLDPYGESQSHGLSRDTPIGTGALSNRIRAAIPRPEHPDDPYDPRGVAHRNLSHQALTGSLGSPTTPADIEASGIRYLGNDSSGADSELRVMRRRHGAPEASEMRSLPRAGQNSMDNLRELLARNEMIRPTSLANMIRAARMLGDVAGSPVGAVRGARRLRRENPLARAGIQRFATVQVGDQPVEVPDTLANRLGVVPVPAVGITPTGGITQPRQPERMDGQRFALKDIPGWDTSDTLSPINEEERRITGLRGLTGQQRKAASRGERVDTSGRRTGARGGLLPKSPTSEGEWPANGDPRDDAVAMNGQVSRRIKNYHIATDGESGGVEAANIADALERFGLPAKVRSRRNFHRWLDQAGGFGRIEELSRGSAVVPMTPARLRMAIEAQSGIGRISRLERQPREAAMRRGLPGLPAGGQRSNFSQAQQFARTRSGTHGMTTTGLLPGPPTAGQRAMIATGGKLGHDPQTVQSMMRQRRPMARAKWPARGNDEVIDALLGRGKTGRTFPGVVTFARDFEPLNIQRQRGIKRRMMRRPSADFEPLTIPAQEGDDFSPLTILRRAAAKKQTPNRLAYIDRARNLRRPPQAGESLGQEFDDDDDRANDIATIQSGYASSGFAPRRRLGEHQIRQMTDPRERRMRSLADDSPRIGPERTDRPRVVERDDPAPAAPLTPRSALAMFPKRPQQGRQQATSARSPMPTVRQVPRDVGRVSREPVSAQLQREFLPARQRGVALPQRQRGDVSWSPGNRGARPEASAMLRRSGFGPKPDRTWNQLISRARGEQAASNRTAGRVKSAIGGGLGGLALGALTGGVAAPIGSALGSYIGSTDWGRRAASRAGRAAQGLIGGLRGQQRGTGRSAAVGQLAGQGLRRAGGFIRRRLGFSMDGQRFGVDDTLQRMRGYSGGFTIPEIAPDHNPMRDAYDRMPTGQRTMMKRMVGEAQLALARRQNNADALHNYGTPRISRMLRGGAGRPRGGARFAAGERGGFMGALGRVGRMASYALPGSPVRTYRELRQSGRGRLTSALAGAAGTALDLTAVPGSGASMAVRRLLRKRQGQQFARCARGA